MSAPQDERAEFERWAESVRFENYSLERMTSKPEFYRAWKTQHAWEGWQARAEYNPEAIEAVIYRCEFMDCTESRISNDLPDGWSQLGESRFYHAPNKLAAWCPAHSKKEDAKWAETEEPPPPAEET